MSARDKVVVAVFGLFGAVAIACRWSDTVFLGVLGLLSLAIVAFCYLAEVVICIVVAGCVVATVWWALKWAWGVVRGRKDGLA